MNPETLIPGLLFSIKYELTQRETSALVAFLGKPHTTLEVAELLKVPKTPLHAIIQRLKLKNLLVLKDRDSKGTNLYEFNLKIFEN